MNSKLAKYAYLMPMLVVGIVCFYFSLTYQWFGDPIYYKFLEPSATDFEAIPQRYVENLRDIWESQCNHYFTSNGRFFVHFITQIFCALAGQAWFAVFNALVWVALISFTLKFALKRRPTAASAITVSILFLILLLPIRFDPPFQINYAWSGLFMIIWFGIFFGRRQYPAYALILIGIFSFLFGECNEGFSIPACFAVAAYTIYKKFRLTAQQWVCAVLMGLGAIVLTISPGSWNRLRETGEYSTGFNINILLEMLPGLIIPAIAILAAWYRRKNFTLKINAESLFFCVFVIANFSLGIITGYKWGPRMLVPGNIVLIILILRVLNRNAFSKTLNITGIALCAATTAIFGVYSEKQNKTERSIYAAFEASDDGIVYLPDTDFTDHMFRILSFDKEYRMEGKIMCPDKPEMRIRPESMRQYAETGDTNVIVRIGPQAWFMVQSEEHPARFILEKRIMPGSLDIRMADLELDFNKRWDVTFEKNGKLRFAVYRNTKPFLESTVRMENTMTE